MKKTELKNIAQRWVTGQSEDKEFLDAVNGYRSENPLLSDFIPIFSAAGYEYISETPKGRLLFYHRPNEENIQFWFSDKTNLQHVMDFICQRAYNQGEIIGKVQIQNMFKKSLDL